MGILESIIFLLEKSSVEENGTLDPDPLRLPPALEPPCRHLCSGDAKRVPAPWSSYQDYLREDSSSYTVTAIF